MSCLSWLEDENNNNENTEEEQHNQNKENKTKYSPPNKDPSCTAERKRYQLQIYDRTSSQYFHRHWLQRNHKLFQTMDN